MINTWDVIKAQEAVIKAIFIIGFILYYSFESNNWSFVLIFLKYFSIGFLIWFGIFYILPFIYRRLFKNKLSN